MGQQRLAGGGTARLIHITPMRPPIVNRANRALSIFDNRNIFTAAATITPRLGFPVLARAGALHQTPIEVPGPPTADLQGVPCDLETNRCPCAGPVKSQAEHETLSSNEAGSGKEQGIESFLFCSFSGAERPSNQ